MCHSFILPERVYKAKTASFVFLILKKGYLLAGSVIISSIGGAVLFANTKTEQGCAFPDEILTPSFKSSLMLCEWEKFTCVSAKWRIPYPMFCSS